MCSYFLHNQISFHIFAPSPIRLVALSPSLLLALSLSRSIARSLPLLYAYFNTFHIRINVVKVPRITVYGKAFIWKNLPFIGFA